MIKKLLHPDKTRMDLIAAVMAVGFMLVVYVVSVITDRK